MKPESTVASIQRAWKLSHEVEIAMISSIQPPKLLTCLLLSAAFFAAGSTAAQTQNACSAWMNKSLTPDERARELLSHMSQNQKLQMIAGSLPWTCCGNASINPIPALCIPTIIYCDGSVGVGDQTG